MKFAENSLCVVRSDSLVRKELVCPNKVHFRRPAVARKLAVDDAVSTTVLTEPPAHCFVPRKLLLGESKQFGQEAMLRPAKPGEVFRLAEPFELKTDDKLFLSRKKQKENQVL